VGLTIVGVLGAGFVSGGGRPGEWLREWLGEGSLAGVGSSGRHEEGGAQKSAAPDQRCGTEPSQTAHEMPFLRWEG
jgi:hypothetical protein